MVITDNIVRGPEMAPLTSTSLGEYMLERLKGFGDKTALVDAMTGKKVTFLELREDICRVARALQSRGIRTGDVVGICTENNLEFALPVLGAVCVGAACTAINPDYTDREMEHVLMLTKPCIMFCSPDTVDTVAQVTQKIPSVREIFVFGDSEVGTPFSDLFHTLNSVEELNIPQIHPAEHVAFILMSSGTTGLPKGVMLTHRNVLSTIAFRQHPLFQVEDMSGKRLGFLPVFHTFGLHGLLLTLDGGETTIVMSRFAPDLFLQMLQDHKIAVCGVVPPLMVFLGKHPMVDDYDLSSLKILACGAAPLSRKVQDQVTTRLGITDIRQGYGLTETTFAVLGIPHDRNKFGSSGVVVPGTEAKVLDVDTGQALGPNKEGELCFRGPVIMKGYIGDPGATAEAIDPDGWLHTGDIGYYDDDGYFFVVDRLKELIKYKAFQVAPAELEAILLTHPEVDDAAVIGVPDEDCGELPRAFVVRSDDSTISECQIQDFVAGQVSSQKRLRGGVLFVDYIPKNPSGKILRRELRQMLRSKL